jgi:hypothetical protein
MQRQFVKKIASVYPILLPGRNADRINDGRISSIRHIRPPIWHFLEQNNILSCNLQPLPSIFTISLDAISLTKICLTKYRRSGKYWQKIQYAAKVARCS